MWLRFFLIWLLFVLVYSTLANSGPHWARWDQDTCPNVAASSRGDCLFGVLGRRECSRDDPMSSTLVLPNARSLKIQTIRENSAGTRGAKRIFVPAGTVLRNRNQSFAHGVLWSLNAPSAPKCAACVGRGFDRRTDRGPRPRQCD